jgi:hypothetical protein
MTSAWMNSWCSSSCCCCCLCRSDASCRIAQHGHSSSAASKWVPW